MAEEERAVEPDFDFSPTELQDNLELTEGDVGSNELDIYIDEFIAMLGAETSDDAHGICLSPTSTSSNTSRPKRLIVPSSFEYLDDSHKRKRDDLQNLVESGQIRIWFETKEPTDTFCGRTDELNKFQTFLRQNNSQPCHIYSKVIIISGPPGVGKTEFVKHCASQLDSTFSVIWINAESKEEMKLSFKRLKDELNIPTIGLFTEDDISVVRKCYEFFANAKVVFIFDNVESFQDEESGIKEFLPFQGFIQPQWIKPNILITTRSLDFPNGFQFLPLSVLTLQEGLQFLNKNIGTSLDDKIYLQLLEELGYFPHALQQATAYIQNTKKEYSLKGIGTTCPVTNFLDLYRQDRGAEKILDYEFWELTKDTYTQTTFSTWKVIFDKILKSKWGVHAKFIMTVCSFLAPDKIPTFLFLNLEFGTEGIQSLASYSVINLTGPFINIHRLSQKIIRVQVAVNKEDEEILLSTTKLLKSYLSIGSDQDFNDQMIDQVKLCLPHGIQLCNNLADRNQLGICSEFREFVISILSTMNALGHLDDAINFGNKYMKLLEGAFGTSCEEVLRMGDHLGQAYINCREWNNARNLYSRIEPKSVDLLGRTHPTTRHITNNLAYTLMISGKFGESMEAYTKMYRTNDPNDLHDLTNKIGLAMVHECLGDYELHKKMLRDGFGGAVFGLNDGHLVSLTIKHNLAPIHMLTNVFKEEFKFLKEYTQDKEVKCGLNSKTLEAYTDVAEELAKLGDLVEAHAIENVMFSDSPEKGIGKYSSPFFRLQLHRAKLKNDLLNGSMYLGEKLCTQIEMLRAKLRNLLHFPSGVCVIHQEKNVVNILFELRKYQKVLQMGARELDKRLTRWSRDQMDVESTQGLIEECTTALGNLAVSEVIQSIDSRGYLGDHEEIEGRTDSESESERECGEGKMYPCQICGAGGHTKSYKNKTSLNRHINSDHLGKIYPCELCGKRFRSDKLLRHKANKYPCVGTKKTS